MILELFAGLTWVLWVSLTADGSRIKGWNYPMGIVDPLTGHYYLSIRGSATAGYGNVYDCYGPAASCTLIPNFGGTGVDHTNSNSSIQSLSITHY